MKRARARFIELTRACIGVGCSKLTSASLWVRAGCRSRSLHLLVTYLLLLTWVWAKVTWPLSLVTWLPSLVTYSVLICWHCRQHEIALLSIQTKEIFVLDWKINNSETTAQRYVVITGISTLDRHWTRYLFLYITAQKIISSGSNPPS